MLPKPFYQDDFCTIYNADCRDILPHLPQVDLVLTDPPYGLGDKMIGGSTVWGHKRRPVNESRKQQMQWDKATCDDVVLRLPEVAPQVVIWGGNYYSLPPSRGWLAWCKPDSVATMGSIEFAWTNKDAPARHLIHSIAATNKERNGHPTQKPLAVMKWCLSFFPESKNILDPFMGSGTTLRAAKDSGLKAIGIEISKAYCQIAVERLRQESLLGIQT